MLGSFDDQGELPKSTRGAGEQEISASPRVGNVGSGSKRRSRMERGVDTRSSMEGLS